MKKSFRTVQLVALFLVLATLVSGCGSAEVVSDPTTVYPANEVPPAGELSERTSEAFLEYYNTNSDFFGQVEIPGIGLSEIVVLDPPIAGYYYSRRDLNKNYRHVGIPYFDNRNFQSGDWDSYTLLYGHNIGKSKYSDQMFGKLTLYRSDETYWETAKTVKFTALNGYTYYFEFFSAYSVASIDYEESDPYYFYPFFATDYGFERKFNIDKQYHYTDIRRYTFFEEFIRNLHEISEFPSDLEVNFNDPILTFMTCIYDDGRDDLRFVMHAKMLDTLEVEALLAADPSLAAEGEIIGNPAPF